MYESGGYGAMSLSFLEVKAYSDSVCELDSFDTKIVVKMSKAYVNEQSAATSDKMRRCPLEENVDFYAEFKAHNKAEVSKKMRMLSQQAR